MDGDEPRRLRRSQEGRLITGVCVGLGRYTRIDPVVFRVAFALLVLTTGVGLVLYAGAFLLMAAPDGGPSKIEQIGRRLFDADTVLALLGVSLAAGALLGMVGDWTSGDGLAVAVVFALTLLVAHSRGVHLAQVVRGLPERVRGRPLPTPPPSPATGEEADRPGPVSPPAAFRPADTPNPPGATPLFDDPPDGRTRVAAPARPPRRRPHPVALTLSAAVLVAAVLFVWTDGSGGRAQLIVAGGLAVIAAGLLLGAFGRDPGLVIVGVIMSLVLASAPLAGDLARKAHNVTWEPVAATAAEQNHRVLVGEGTVDLTRVPLAPGRRLRVTAQVTVGSLTVRVPAAARVEVDGRALLGDITVDRHVTSGPRATVRRVLEPEGGTGGVAPVIELRIRSKIGDMDVTRV